MGKRKPRKTIPAFALRLRKLRERAKLSQREVDKLAGYDAQTFAHYENGDRDNPSFQTLERFAKALNATVGDILS